MALDGEHLIKTHGGAGGDIRYERGFPIGACEFGFAQIHRERNPHNVGIVKELPGKTPALAGEELQIHLADAIARAKRLGFRKKHAVFAD
ncbi:hypothetical protein SDC9_147114 [bioreactor metagenome]|uniref:Uncharacterized protein n=1 Tax=bioreactor metagenome TaxID=1076179 RepID=A0A645EF06_9ZZZZ